MNFGYFIIKCDHTHLLKEIYKKNDEFFLENSNNYINSHTLRRSDIQCPTAADAVWDRRNASKHSSDSETFLKFSLSLWS